MIKGLITVRNVRHADTWCHYRNKLTSPLTYLSDRYWFPLSSVFTLVQVTKPFQTYENVDANGRQVHFALLLKQFDLIQNQENPTRRRHTGLSDGENAVTCPPSDRRARRSARSRSLRRIVGGYRAADRILRRVDLRLRSLRLYFGKTGFRFDNVKALTHLSFA